MLSARSREPPRTRSGPVPESQPQLTRRPRVREGWPAANSHRAGKHDRGRTLSSPSRPIGRRLAPPTKGEVKMTATHRSRPRRPTALTRRLRITIAALALSALGLGAGTSVTQAADGRVYWDTNANAAAGDPAFL